MTNTTDDTVPHLTECHGVEPDAAYGPASVISCPTCKEKVTVETAPFFRDPQRQREHQVWRAADVWNERQAR
ncbi:hypothetical protein HFO06_11205 [Rhizobium leguminosarum]|uniref:hypothetical protein n=1 Tax=Rhizobium leguminosarum TaxID=384 RepID=UPI001C970073|nr:hypothetical protein [Rhizobium leguminosarum]MBY5763656.1 hypothetical protein [Rhizobium leguminosarum]